MAGSAAGSIKHLETSYFSAATSQFSSGVKEYNNIKTDVKKTVDKLLSTWDGEGQKQYKYDYSILYKQLEDIGDVLYELYDALVEAEAAYVKADHAIGKEFTV